MRLADGGCTSLEVRTNDGRKMNRPSNLHGYSESSPFLSPIVLGTLDSGVSNEGSVGHLNACNDVDDGTSVVAYNGDEIQLEWKASIPGRIASTTDRSVTPVIKADIAILIGFDAAVSMKAVLSFLAHCPTVPLSSRQRVVRGRSL